MQDVAKKIVYKEQMGFVQGIFILDIVIVAWEAMEWAREYGKQALFLKIDVDKAYDRVNWTFIIDMLSCLGFGSKCVGMIKNMFSSTLYFVVVNNILSPCILVHHSIRK